MTTPPGGLRAALRLPALLMVRAMPLLVVAISVCGCALQQPLDARGDVAGTGPTRAPVLAGVTVDGRRFDPASLSGHVAVILFWASWCGPCRAEQGDANALHARLAPRGVVFAGVDMRDDVAAAAAFQRDLGVPYPSIEDTGGALTAAYDVSAPPTMIIVDRNGRIAMRLLGTTAGAEARIAALR